MADVFRFDVEGIETMFSRLQFIDQSVERRISDTLTKLAHQIIADAKRLAPIDTGDLEASLVVGDVVKTLYEIYIEFGNSPETDGYALLQHEGFMKTQNGSVVELKPGEKTRSKGAHKGFQPGKKYLENAIKMNEKLIRDEIQKVLAIGGT